MGLAVAKILATGMGGDIRYEREDGWTRFVLILPLAQAATSGSAEDLLIEAS